MLVWCVCVQEVVSHQPREDTPSSGEQDRMSHMHPLLTEGLEEER